MQVHQISDQEKLMRQQQVHLHGIKRALDKGSLNRPLCFRSTLCFQELLHGLEERLAAVQSENAELNRTLQGVILDKSHPIRHTSHLTPNNSHLTPHTSQLTPNTSHLSPHTSHTTHHTSHLTPHTSHLTPGSCCIRLRFESRC